MYNFKISVFNRDTDRLEGHALFSDRESALEYKLRMQNKINSDIFKELAESKLVYIGPIKINKE